MAQHPRARWQSSAGRIANNRPNLRMCCALLGIQPWLPAMFLLDKVACFLGFSQSCVLSWVVSFLGFSRDYKLCT